MPEKKKKCPKCGGPLKECRVPVIVSEIRRLFRGGLTMETKPIINFRRSGYQCPKCGVQISTKKLSELQEVYLQHEG